MNNKKVFLKGLISIFLLCIFSYFIYLGLNPKPDPVPIIEKPISVGTDFKPQGEKSIDAIANEITMNNNTIMIPQIKVYAPINVEDSNGTLIKDYGYKIPEGNEVTFLEDTRKEKDKKKPRGLVVSGHVYYNEKNGVLHDLAKVSAGNMLMYKDNKGIVSTYKMIESKNFEKNSIPDKYLNPPSNEMIVITCSDIKYLGNGLYHFEDNTVLKFIKI